MQSRNRQVTIGFLLFTGACLFAIREDAPRPLALAGEGPAFEKQVNLVYTVSNFGYTDTCG